MHTAADLKALEQHPFVARLLQHVDLTQSDLSSLNAVIDGETEKMIAGSERQIEFLDPRAIRTLAQYQSQELAPIPLPTSA
jgi:hypothetical protein